MFGYAARLTVTSIFFVLVALDFEDMTCQLVAATPRLVILVPSVALVRLVQRANVYVPMPPTWFGTETVDSLEQS